MEFTGERYVPSDQGQIKYEHLHRYALSLQFAKGKTVLDLASGEGYGAALLANVARSVIGVDIDPVSVDYANDRYSNYGNLKFSIGSCDAVPLPNNSVDVVTSFETIEHHDRHEEMMSEIKRVLKPGGILIISSPNRLTYSDEPNYSNPYHVKELYYEELLNLLSRYFKYVKFYGQRMASSSFVFALENSSQTNWQAYTDTNNTIEQKVCSLDAPIYFVAICSDREEEVELPADSIYIDRSDDLFKNIYQGWLQTQTELERVQSQLQHIHTDWEKSQSQLQQTQAELTQSQSQLQQTQAELTQSQSQLQQTQSELTQSQSQLQQTQSELTQSQSQLQQTHTHWEKTQLQLQQTQAELTQSQSQLQQTQAELTQSQSQLQQNQSELTQSQSQLQQTQEEWEKTQTQLRHSLAGWERSHTIIEAIESSKFWKLRQIWFKFKQAIGLQSY
jgi:ubiquinone/menaquinone biosynthesis C-methylase UbiE